MFNFFIGSHGFQAAMLRMCFWLMSIGLAVTANKAQSEESSFAPDQDMPAVYPAYSGTDWLYPYRPKADVVLARVENTAAPGPEFSIALRPHLASRQKEQAAWSTNSRWQFSNGDRTSFSPVLRFDSDGKRIEIKPRRDSIWVVWRKALN